MNYIAISYLFTQLSLSPDCELFEAQDYVLFDHLTQYLGLDRGSDIA